jgi:hypothetical protein
VLWWTWRSAILTVEFHIPWFQALLWLHVDSIQKRILRAYNEILKSGNNEWIEYKVEHGNSIQKHILRVYIMIMKYSNLGTMNASSIRWSTVASKLEHGRPCCNVLDASCSNLATSCLMPFLRQKSLAGFNHHPLQQPTLSLPAPGSASISPPCTPFLHAFALLPWKVCHLLPSISCPAPCPHCVAG